MSKRRVIIAPNHFFDFKTNAEYAAEWDFLKDEDRRNIIAAQMTYLAFHSWLYHNLRTEKGESGQHDVLFGDVSEGFIRTDLLLYAAVCESALLDIVDWVYRQGDDHPPRAVRDCFERTPGPRYPDLVDIPVTSNTRHGLFNLIWEPTPTEDNASPNFVQLIRAGRAIGVYNEAFMRRIDGLRADRNTIHLAERIERKKNDKLSFTPDDRNRARGVTESLRDKIRHWYAASD